MRETPGFWPFVVVVGFFLVVEVVNWIAFWLTMR